LVYPEVCASVICISYRTYDIDECLNAITYKDTVYYILKRKYFKLEEIGLDFQELE
jgi:citrate synthase